jgi:major type 1 subunit fimbrin (pilin)
MTTNRLSRFLQVLAMLIVGALAMIATPAAATSSCTGGGQTLFVPMPATVTLARDSTTLPVGAVLTPWTSMPFVTYYTCSITDASDGNVPAGMAIEAVGLTDSGMKTVSPRGFPFVVWNTNYPGVGIAIGVNIASFCSIFQEYLSLSASAADPLPGIPANWTTGSCNTVSSQNISTVNQAGIQVALVKTGPIAPGTFAGGVIADGALLEETSSNSGVFQLGTANARTNFSISPTTFVLPTCSTSDVVVNLPTVSPAALTPANTIAGTKPFSVSLNCPAGNPVGVYMTLTDNTSLGNTTNNLTLAPSSSATGVAIRITNVTTGTDISYGPPSAAQGNLNQFKVGTLGTAGGTITVPFTASYVSTSGTVTGGAVRAVSTFTMSYQ